MGPMAPAHTYESQDTNEGDTQRIGRPRANLRRALERVAGSATS